MGQSAHERVGMSTTGGPLNLLAHGARTAVGYVVVHGALEQPAVLQHHAERPTQTLAGARLDGHPVDANLTRVHVVKAQEQIDESRLAAPSGAHKRHTHTRARVQADVSQHGMLFDIRKINMVKHDIARRNSRACRMHVQLDRIFRIRHVLNGIEERENTARRGICALNLRHHRRDLVERLGVLVRIRQEDLNLAHSKRGGEPGNHADESRHGHCGVYDVVYKAGSRIGERA